MLGLAFESDILSNSACDSDDIQCSPDYSLIDKLTRFIV